MCACPNTQICKIRMVTFFRDAEKLSAHGAAFGTLQATKKLRISVVWVLSRNTAPILSRDPSFWKTSGKNDGARRSLFEMKDGLSKKGKGSNP